ncbi:MAG: aminodeoxychorismate/anthranilate synthase component II [Phycisphaerales bacterium]|nr:aminodeoxychorismate/anthranilate synthase component II [Phycisphaerales bacterium]
MLLLIDNYDSFTWNLVHAFGALRPDIPVEVCRNDQLTLEDAITMAPSHLVISPGPCTPEETGVCRDLVRHFTGRIPVLGVCLGHQAIADVHGMEVVQHARPMHGKTSMIHHDGKGLFQDLPNPFEATRYHSLVVRRNAVPEDMEVSAWTEEDDIMALRWKPGWPDGNQAALVGVQFHPESFLTSRGPTLLQNFLSAPVPGGVST